MGNPAGSSSHRAKQGSEQGAVGTQDGDRKKEMNSRDRSEADGQNPAATAGRGTGAQAGVAKLWLPVRPPGFGTDTESRLCRAAQLLRIQAAGLADRAQAMSL